jgi:hypothetical protein
MRLIGIFSRSTFSAYKVIACIGFALVVGSCSKPNPPDWKTVLASAARQQQANPNAGAAQVSTTNHIVVYLDTSASMAGYVSKDRRGQTVFSRTLQELRNLTTILNPPMDVLVRHVSTGVEAPLGDSDLSVASVTSTIYTGRETDLAGAIGEFTRPVVPGRGANEAGGQVAAGGPVADEPPPARYHILITDGVQSTTQQRLNVACVTGSDQVCVRKKILELLNKGWGATVIGMRSEFDGKVFSEVGRTVTSYQSRGGDPQSFRPFYIYLFSPDRAALGKLSEVLRERLRPLVGQEESFRELSLTSNYAEGFARAEAAVEKEKRDVLELSRAREENPTGLTLRVDLDTEKTGPETFSLTVDIPWSGHARYTGTPQEKARLVNWSVVPVYQTGEATNQPEGWRYPELRITGQQVDAEGRALLQVAAQWPRATGDPGWRVYRLEGRLNFEKQTPAWVEQWSTNLDTTAEVANRTLNLESVLLGLWRNDVLKNQPVAEAYLRVGPR